MAMSYQEKRVASYLKNKNINYVIEPQLMLKDKWGKLRAFYPDFFLYDLGIYLEVCGADRSEDYGRRKEAYKKNHIDIIFVETFKDDYKWKYHLDKSIQEIQARRQEIIGKPLPEKPIETTFINNPCNHCGKESMPEFNICWQCYYEKEIKKQKEEGIENPAVDYPVKPKPVATNVAPQRRTYYQQQTYSKPLASQPWFILLIGILFFIIGLLLFFTSIGLILMIGGGGVIALILSLVLAILGYIIIINHRQFTRR